jgi:hypothetical protein
VRGEKLIQSFAERAPTYDRENRIPAVGHPDGSGSCPEERAMELFYHDVRPASHAICAEHSLTKIGGITRDR